MSKRATPIESSIEPVGNGCPESLATYNIECSPYFYARFWMGKPHDKYKTKSLLTEIRMEARKRAKAFWIETIRKDAIGEPIFAPSKLAAVAETYDFIEVGDLLFAEDLGRVNSEQLKKSTYDKNLAVYEADLKNFFGKMNCRDINYKKIQEYDKHLNSRENCKTLANKSLLNHHNILSKILNHALALEYIDRAPKFPKIKVKRGNRSWLPPNDYTDLIVTIDKMITDKVKVKKGGVVTTELKLLVSFMVNSYLRDTDIYDMQHKHIQRWASKEGKPHIKIWAMSKPTQKEPCWVTPNDAAVGILSELCLINKGATEPEDYVFFPGHTRGTRIGMIAKQFAEALKLAGLYVEPNTKVVRDLLTLRHTCAMNAVNSGMNIKALADRMRSSLAMLSQTYLNHTNNEENVGSEQTGGTLEGLFEAAESDV